MRADVGRDGAGASVSAVPPFVLVLGGGDGVAVSEPFAEEPLEVEAIPFFNLRYI